MTPKLRLCAASALLAIAAALPAGAATMTVFEETFDAENGGMSRLNYDGFAQFGVSSGTVDLIASGGFGIACAGGTGVCVDTDGSTGDAGRLLSGAISFLAGTLYTLSFDVSGNQRSAASDALEFGITSGLLSGETITLAGNAPFQTVARSFTPLAGASGSIFFEGAGGDNLGLILDNVRLTATAENGGPGPSPIPLPAGLPLLLAGLAALGIARRRG